jgi:hypothetical protein
MAHEEFKRDEEIVGSSNRTFGLVFAAVFAIIALWPLVFGTGGLRSWSAAVAAAFAACAFLFPAVLAPLNRLWMRFGLLLHAIVNPVVLAIMYFLVITPTGLLMRLFGKDPLRLSRDPAAATYWIDRKPPGPAPESMRDQF